MTDLKMIWLLVFLNYAAFDTAAENTSPAALAAEPHIDALSQNNLEVHVKGNLSGHIELTTLEVISTTFSSKLDFTAENNETSTEAVYKKLKTDEDILENPFHSKENVGLSSEEKSTDVNVNLQSASPLSSTDNSENDEEAAAKQLTDGSKSNDVINGSETSGNSVAINEEHGSETPVTNGRAPLPENYNFMNEKEDGFTAADEGISTMEMNDEENLFTESDEGSDESLFELNDPTEETWFGVNLEEDANTYRPSGSISELEDIKKLLTETPTEAPLDLSEYTTEISVTEIVNEEEMERNLENNETKLETDLTPTKTSANYSEEINHNGENIGNSDSFSISGSSESSETEVKQSDIDNIKIEGNKEKTEVNLTGGKEKNVEEYITENIKYVKTISESTTLSSQEIERSQPGASTTEVSVLENNTELTKTTVNDLSSDETDEDSISEDSSYSSESENDISSEIYEDRIEKESAETDSVDSNEDKNISEHVTESITEIPTTQKIKWVSATTDAIIDQASKDDTSENNSDTKEDSTEIPTGDIQSGFSTEDNSTRVMTELVTEVKSITPQNIADSFTKLSSENMAINVSQNSLEDVEKTTVDYGENNLPTQNYEAMPEDIDTYESSSSEEYKEDEVQLEYDNLNKTEIISKNEKDSEGINGMVNESIVNDFKIDGKLFLNESNLLTTETPDVGTERSEYQTTDGTFSSITDYIVGNLYETTPKINNLKITDISKKYDGSMAGNNTLPVETVNNGYKIIPVREASEEFDIVEPEGLFSHVSTNFEGDRKNIENIAPENLKGYGVNTENSNPVDIDLSKKISDITALRTNDSKLDNINNSTITNTASDESDSLESEDDDSGEYSVEIPEQFPYMAAKVVERESKEKELEGEITPVLTTEINSNTADGALSEKTTDTTIQGRNYFKLNNINESSMVTNTTHDDSYSLESEEYVSEENIERIPELFPYAVAEETETSQKEKEMESKITSDPEVNDGDLLEKTTDTTALGRNGFKQENADDSSMIASTTSDESESFESEEYVSERISEEFPSVPSETFSIETNKKAQGTERTPKETETESEITLKPTTEVSSDKTIFSEESDSVENEKYVTEENSEETDQIALENKSTLAPTIEVTSDKITLSAESDSVEVEESTTKDRVVVDTDTASKDEMETEIILSSTTEVNYNESIQSEESDSVDTEEYASEETYEDISKEFTNINISKNVSLTNRTESVPVEGVHQIDENSFPETTSVGTDVTAVDSVTASKEEVMESELTLEPTTEATSDKFIQFEELDSDENEEHVTEQDYLRVPKEFPSNGNIPEIFPLIDSGKVVPVISISELEEANPEIAKIFLTGTETITAVDTEIAKKQEEMQKVTTLEPITNISEVAKPTNQNISFSLNEVPRVLQNVNRTNAQAVITNGTIEVILNSIIQRVLTTLRNRNFTENGTNFVTDKSNAEKSTQTTDKINVNTTETIKPNVTDMDSDEDEDSYSQEDSTEEDAELNGEKNKTITMTFENKDEEDISISLTEEIDSDESDITTEDLNNEIISNEAHVPYILGKVFENDVNVSIKIVAEETTFYVPPYAYLLENLDNLVLNVTWSSSNKILNNSLSLTLTQISKYYVINGVQLNIVRNSEMLIWKKNVVILPKKMDKTGEYDCVIEFEDGVEVSISNINFLSKASSEENENNSGVHSSTSEITGRGLVQAEIAVGCVAIALMLGAVIYLVITKAKKRSLKMKNLAAQEVAA